MRHQMNRIEFKAKFNNIGSYGINKISLSSYKDKRICT